MKFQLLATILVIAFINKAWTASVGKPICGGSSSSKIIQLINPLNPPRECIYKINAYSSNVCQLRIQLTYTLAQPSVPNQDNALQYVQCDKDYFEAGDLKLCGVENNQHIYLPFNSTAGVTSMDLKIALTHRLASLNLPKPQWNIMVTQLECPAGAAIRSVESIEPFSSSKPTDGFWVAPPGCLQYFPHQRGTINSFNFQNGKGIYPGNMNYAICFRRSSNTKSLLLRNYYFQLGSNGSSDTENTDGYCYAGLKNTNQASDYLLIPQAAIETTGQKASYFCGDSIKNKEVVSTNPGPLMVIFNSDGLYSNESGFSIDYKLISE